MTSQITARSWNYLVNVSCRRAGTLQSRPVRHYNNRHIYRSRINPHECSHKRKWPSKLHARPQDEAPAAVGLLLCNHDLTTFSSAAECDLPPGLRPCGKCNVLGRLSGRSSTHTAPHTHHAHLTAHSLLTAHHTLTSLTPHDTNWVVVRALHTTSLLLEESKSKLEDAVKALKEEKANKQSTEGSDRPAPSANAVAKEPPKAVQKKSIGQRIMAEVRHYYHGFRLLFIDVKLCARYMWNVLMGRSLNRRERRQLVRTTADLFRLVPFLVFIIIPFMEFLLPVALKLFPGMLPSTFNEEKKEQESLRKKLKGKLEMAKFLQDTLEEMAVQKKGSDESRVHEFNAFLKRIRISGEQTTNEEIIKYSKLFKDEITLDSLGHAQLTALCKLLDLQAIGTNAFLRFQLRMKLRQLEADDRMIDKEGVDSLAVWELQEACRARGMRSLGVSTQRLQLQLQQWLDLHLDDKVPASLLLLSRTLYMPTDVALEEQLKATLSVLPETTAEEAKVTISEVAGERVDNKTKLEIIRQEEVAIREEREQTQLEQAENAKKKEEEAVVAEPLSPEQVAAQTGVKVEEVLIDTAPELKPTEVIRDPAERLAADKEEPISVKELEDVEEVLEAESNKRQSLKIEQEELEALKEDVTEYKENLEDLKEVGLTTEGPVVEMKESKGAQRLLKHVDKLVSQMDKLVGGLHADKDLLTEEIEVREVRIRRSKELQEDQDMRQEVLNQISTKKANLIGINELLLSMKRLQKISDDTKFQRIMEVLDEDQDGKIDIDDALKVIDLLGQENVMVSASKMSEIIELLRTEAQIEEEARRLKDATKVKADDPAATKVKEDGPQPVPEELLKDATGKGKNEQKQV